MTLAIDTSIDRLRAAAEGKQFEMRRSDGVEWMPMSADQLIGELAGSEHAAAIILARLEGGHRSLIEFTDEFEIRAK